MGGGQNETVGERLRRIRTRVGISQRELAERTVDGDGQVTHSHISRIERGARHPSTTAAIKLANALGVSALKLITGKPDGTCPLCGRDGPVPEKR